MLICLPVPHFLTIFLKASACLILFALKSELYWENTELWNIFALDLDQKPQILAPLLSSRGLNCYAHQFFGGELGERVQVEDKIIISIINKLTKDDSLHFGEVGFSQRSQIGDSIISYIIVVWYPATVFLFPECRWLTNIRCSWYCFPEAAGVWDNWTSHPWWTSRCYMLYCRLINRFFTHP